MNTSETYMLVEALDMVWLAIERVSAGTFPMHTEHGMTPDNVATSFARLPI